MAIDRPRVDGKFFRLGSRKLYLKGLSYGPFRPKAGDDPFPTPEQTERDFKQIRELGANLLRVYHVPPRWFLDLAAAHELLLLIDVPWPKHLCFLDRADLIEAARDSVRDAVGGCRAHPAVFAYSVANEVPADIVRWSGVVNVTAFIESLVEVAKEIDPDCLCTFSSFPPTEYLRPNNLDFLCFNVYLHQQSSLENYLARLQMLADSRPLVLGEFGMDALRNGPEHQAEFLTWQIETAFRSGLAGAVVFSYTDDWFRGGFDITDWQFGLTTRDRQPKLAFDAVKKSFAVAPYFPLPQAPRASVVVACYNGAHTLRLCLDSLQELNYPDYEAILVDDGSTDATPEIAREFPKVRYVRQDNHGLSVARNTGIATATGEVIVFTDADCRADADWLFYLVGDLVSRNYAAIGGHNFLPPDDSPAAAAVMVSPGGPAHVMLTDREAEHVPGCNMAFYKWALDEIGGFDPVFRKAGDDVDVCWRILERGFKIGFSPAGFVWHYRRSNVAAYLKQQSGYGEAEGLLARKHPEYFNPIGMSLWRGRIYSSGKYGVVLRRPVIYHGLFGGGFFQKLYAPEPAHMLMLLTTLEYHVLVTLPLFVLSVSFYALWPVAVASLGLSLGICVAAALQAELPRKKRRYWSRPMVALLFFLQPIVRGWARYRWSLNVRSAPQAAPQPGSHPLPTSAPAQALSYWGNNSIDRFWFLDRVMVRLDTCGWQNKTDTGWSQYDLEIFDRWSRLRLTTAVEEIGGHEKIFRCRLEPAWSLRARGLFGVVAAAELLGIGFFAPRFPWIWMILLTLLVLFWFLQYETRNMQFQVTALLDGVAAELKLISIKESAQGPSAPNPASPTPTVAESSAR